MLRRLSILLSAALLLTLNSSALARGVYQEPADFIAQAFAGDPPKTRTLYIRGELKQQIRKILGHRYPKIRLRYWLKDGRSAWILEEIGKERPITAGFVVRDNTIEQAKILAFRESRGWEVRRDSFVHQFRGAGLESPRSLDRHIDNISGATLSVRAVRAMARLALFLHRQVTRSKGDATS